MALLRCSDARIFASRVRQYRGKANDVWERPLRYIPNEKLKRQGGAEKEARLLVACWQGREEEVKKIFNSGKPQPRMDCSSLVREEHEYRVRGKANRSQTKIAEIKFPKNDLYRFGSPLHKAALRGDAAIVEMLLENTTAAQLLDEKTEVGNTPLHNAAFRGHVEVCEILLDALTDVQTNVGKKGQKLENGDNTVNASIALLGQRNRFLSTPLDKAIENNQKAVITLFNEWPARWKKRNDLTDSLRKEVDKYSKDIALLKGAASAGLRGLVREAEKPGRPGVKPKLLQDARALLARVG